MAHFASELSDASWPWALTMKWLCELSATGGKHHITTMKLSTTFHSQPLSPDRDWQQQVNLVTPSFVILTLQGHSMQQLLGQLFNQVFDCPFISYGAFYAYAVWGLMTLTSNVPDCITPLHLIFATKNMHTSSYKPNVEPTKIYINQVNWSSTFSFNETKTEGYGCVHSSSTHSVQSCGRKTWESPSLSRLNDSNSHVSWPQNLSVILSLTLILTLNLLNLTLSLKLNDRCNPPLNYTKWRHSSRDQSAA